ncbi:hypothetical protein ABI59_23595 [Acidobacteria bacterium Mor1]|nr:hypothetical protein ABI59_23595 [Acidobacteria bacterium Mor1]
MKLDRRRFLQVSALAGGGFALSVALPQLSRALTPAAADSATALNAFLRVHADGSIVFVSPNIEMGQGVLTSHSMIVAEELDADIESFSAVHSPVAPEYNNPAFQMMGTGGSTSTPAFWMPLRQAGAAARAMLVGAAAERLGVPASRLRTERGNVLAPDGSSLGYGELAEAAANIEPPAEPKLKDPSRFTLIGRSTKRLEGRDKVTGAAEFGIDLRLPGMLTAVVARPPAFGITSGTARNEAEISKMSGVRKVKSIPSGIAVLADSYWQARRACDRLEIDWDNSTAHAVDTEARLDEYARIAETEGMPAESEGDAESRIGAAGDDAVEATFRFPYLAHAPMEPLNATAHIRDGEAAVWAGTYFQTIDTMNIAAALGLPPEKVRLHTLLAGGAFGRRANAASDFLMDAVHAALGENVPVKVVWSRPDDIRGGYYRPISLHRMKGSLDAKGMPAAWHQRIVQPSIVAGTPLEPFLVHDGVDHTTVEGATGMPYRIPHRKVELHSPEVDVSVLWWRSVGHTQTCYAGEHFLDILAHRAGKDPLEYRRALLGRSGDPRLMRVLNLAAEKAGWGKKLPDGRAHGIALRKSFNSYVCQVFECSLSDDGMPLTHRVTCAVDVGTPINPWNIEQQVQGAIAYGMTAALYGSVDIDNGAVRQSNFHDYRILRMHEMPPIDVHIVPSNEAPTGIGEPGTPPVAPAMANAKLALTGEPTYRLPFSAKGA